MSDRSRQPVLDDPLDALASQPDASSAIDAWLSVFARLMHLPESTRQSIRMELREHLRERVRDLVLSGGSTGDERDAVRLAIEELGETAELARRFEAANTSNRRRMLMHATLLLAGAGAIVAGVVTFSHSTNNNAPVAVSRFEQSAEVTQAPPKALTDTKVTVTADTTLHDAVTSIVQQAKVGLIVDWGTLQDNGITTEEAMAIAVTEVPAGQALTLLAESAGTREAPLDWRARGGAIEFGLRRGLDAREIELMTYDISATINIIGADFAESKDEASEQVIHLLTELVEPENWRDNGGDLAQLKLVGGRLFVEAPSRMHGKVKWILDQLPNIPGNKPQVNAVDGGGTADGVPLLKDIPLLNEMFTPPGDDQRMESLGKALEGARDEFHLVRQRYDSKTVAYEAAEQKVRDAEVQYNAALQQRESQSSLRPGDVLNLEVFELLQAGEWFRATRQIEADGMVRFPVIGEINASDKTARDIEQEAIARLKATMMAEPLVSVYRLDAATLAAMAGTGQSKDVSAMVDGANDPGGDVAVKSDRFPQNAADPQLVEQLRSLKNAYRKAQEERKPDDPALRDLEQQIQALEAQIARQNTGTAR